MRISWEKHHGEGLWKKQLTVSPKKKYWNKPFTDKRSCGEPWSPMFCRDIRLTEYYGRTLNIDQRILFFYLECISNV